MQEISCSERCRFRQAAEILSLCGKPVVRGRAATISRKDGSPVLNLLADGATYQHWGFQGPVNSAASSERTYSVQAALLFFAMQLGSSPAAVPLDPDRRPVEPLALPGPSRGSAKPPLARPRFAFLNDWLGRVRGLAQARAPTRRIAQAFPAGPGGYPRPT
jgi:hypothetical protein